MAEPMREQKTPFGKPLEAKGTRVNKKHDPPKNLTRWRKGQSGNPSGRAHGMSLTKMLHKIGEEQIKVTGIRNHLMRKWVLANMVWDLLTDGQTTWVDGTAWNITPTQWIELMSWVTNRLDGSPSQSVDITSGDKPIKPPINLSVFTTEELTTFVEYLNRASGGPGGLLPKPETDRGVEDPGGNGNL